MKLEVKDGCYSYGSHEVLKDVSFSVSSGEVLAVLGQNGIGKTTLLRCTMGLLKWKSGETLLDGRNLSEYKSADVWKKIAYVPQARNNISSCTAREMVLLGRSAHLGLFQQPSDKDREIADRAIRFVHMEKLADKMCNRISGGELQMILIARALCTEPEMLVLDEPESNLDFRNQLLVLDTIQRLSKEQGIAAVINTHYPVHALKIADKAIVLNDDLSSIYGNCQDVVNEQNLSSAFHVDVRISENSFSGNLYKSVVPIRLI